MAGSLVDCVVSFEAPRACEGAHAVCKAVHQSQYVSGCVAHTELPLIQLETNSVNGNYRMEVKWLLRDSLLVLGSRASSLRF